MVPLFLIFMSKMFDETWFQNGKMCWFCSYPIMAKVGIRQMTGGGGAVWQCCYILLHTLEVKVSVSWLLLCKVACYRNKVKPCTVLYCTALYCTVLACYRNKVKPAVKMSDDVNSVVLSPVTSYTTTMGTAGATELSKSAKAWHKNYSSASTSIIRTRMTPTRANITMYDNGGTLGFLDTDNRTTYNRSW